MLTYPDLANEKTGAFKSAFNDLIGSRTISTIVRWCGVARRRPPKLSAHELVAGLVFHGLRGCGTLAENIRMITGERVAKSSLSERRQNLPWEVFDTIMKAVLRPKAQEDKHADAFY